ncbi:uncharacterized protein LOC124368533 isoform X2 [Homalodisca vitripennis]|nr:uncharacterized protein LOC124368533 isoform X2 [Homalodisca vitripennis]KAG8322141.1 hypothetical protein J6590_029838 [Homalodisca vitripennis]
MSRLTFILILASAIIATSASRRNNKHCRRNLNTINFSLHDSYCQQPLFVTFAQKTEENLMLDNICLTFFPLPDDSETFQVYMSKIYCDGSSEIISFVATQMETGISKFASPYCTFTDTVFGYAGCDTYLVYRCFEFGDCGSVDGTLVFGLSKQCKTIGLSCLRKVEEIVEESKIRNKEYYVLPMKLPNQCVTQQLCVAPPNPFYNHLPAHTARSLHK